jgi:Tfp pilus assembly protein PilF
LALFALAFLGGCATQPPPITKLVDGRQISTRSVDADAYEHAGRALLYEDEDRWQDAADEIRRALVFDPDSPELHAHLAELYLRLDRLSEAAQAVRDSLKLGVSAPGLLADAHVRRARGDLAGAVEALRKAQTQVDFQAEDDDAESVYLELAEVELQLLDVPAARATLGVLCAGMPASGTGHMRLMAVYWAQGEMSKAEDELRAALAEEPNQIDALAALAWIHAATGRNDKAREAFRQALDRSENALDIAAAFARFLVSIGAKQEAEQLADDVALPEASLDASTLGLQIEVERAAKRWDRALALLDRAPALGIAESPKTHLAQSRATLLKEKGQVDQAIATLAKVGKSSPQFFEARLRAAEMLRETGKYDEAQRTVEDALGALDKADAKRVEIDATVSLAIIDEKRGQPAAGIARLQKLLASHPDDLRANLTLAAIEERRGGWQRALTVAERLLTKQPGSVELLNFWGFVAADHGFSLDLAGKRIEVASALDPGSGGLLDSLGWVHFRKQHLTRALMFLEQAARLEPADPEIQWHLGEAYAERQDKDRAAAAFRRALGFHPEARLRQKLEASLARLAKPKGASR